MKKIAAVLIAVSTIASVAAPAFAATTQHKCVYLDKSMCGTSDSAESISSTKNN